MSLHGDPALHAVVSNNDGHIAPLQEGAVSIVRPRVDDPVPHVTEHGAQTDQADTAQSTRQQLLHDRVSDKLTDEHGSPPHVSAAETLRVRVAMPLQVPEHAPHVVHTPTTQLVGPGQHSLTRTQPSSSCSSRVPKIFIFLSFGVEKNDDRLGHSVFRHCRMENN